MCLGESLQADSVIDIQNALIQAVIHAVCEDLHFKGAIGRFIQPFIALSFWNSITVSMGRIAPKRFMRTVSPFTFNDVVHPSRPDISVSLYIR